MDSLTTLLEALLMSLAVIGAAALDMVLLVLIFFCFFIVAVLLRWVVDVAYHAGVAAYHRSKRR